MTQPLFSSSNHGAWESWGFAYLWAWPLLPFQGSLCATSHPPQWRRQLIRQSATSSISTGGTRGCTRPYEKARGYRAWNRSVRLPQEQLGSVGRPWASSALVCASGGGFGAWGGKGSRIVRELAQRQALVVFCSVPMLLVTDPADCVLCCH